MMMQLSFLSRTTSISYSFQPSTDLLDQHLAGRRGVDAALDDVDELVLVVGDAAAGAAHGERRADDRGQADVFERSSACAKVLIWCERGVSRPILVMALRNSSRSSALSIASAVAPIILTLNLSSTPIFFSDSAVLSAVWPAHGGQQRVGALLLDDLGDDLRRDRLDVGRVGQIRIGHDRGRVGIHQHDPVALGLEGLAGLGSRIVELAGLADDDRAGADDQDRFDVGALRHRASNHRRDSPAHKKRARCCASFAPGGDGPARVGD
jgi:hypothetical protein